MPQPASTVPAKASPAPTTDAAAATGGHPPEPGAAEKATPPQPPEPWYVKALAALPFLAVLVGIGAFTSPFLLRAWERLPGPLPVRWLLVGLILVLVVIVYFSLRAQEGRSFEVKRDFTMVVFVVCAAAALSVYFARDEQVLQLKLFAILFLSFLPASLYLQFIANRARALWDEYVLNLFRLRIDRPEFLPRPPRVSPFWREWAAGCRHSGHEEEKVSGEGEESESEKSLYQKKFEGLFGNVHADGSVAFRGENLLPVLIATLLISVCWVVVMQPETVFALRFLTSVDEFQLSGLPVVPLETFRFAFIGAYFYVLQMLVRRYFQNDLKTNAYVSGTARIVVVLLLVWVMEVLWGAKLEQAERSAIAFVVGVFPDVGWQLLVGGLKTPIQKLVPSLRSQYPLSDLDGLNLWYESRLLEEGIEDLQNLATANLVDVILNTRVPVERLVDWVDQALLFLHLDKQGHPSREELRRFGIRTASDLADVVAHHPIVTERLEQACGAGVVGAILATLRNEPNFFHVKQWRCYAQRYLVAESASTTEVAATG